MAKCRHCGAEGHPFAGECPFLRDDGAGEPVKRKKGSRFPRRLAFIAVLLLFGAVLTVGGILKATHEDSREAGDWVPVASSGLFITSAGFGLLVYSLAGAGRPLWEVREGRRSRSLLSVGLMSFGIMTVIFDLGYLAIRVIIDNPIGSGMIHLLALIVSLLAVATGYLERPASILNLDRRKSISRRMSVAIGILLILVGTLVPGATLVYALSHNTSPLPTLAALEWMILLGFVSGACGLGMIFPSGRWWVPGGVLKRFR